MDASITELLKGIKSWVINKIYDKQDKLTDTQIAAVDSGVTATKVSSYDRCVEYMDSLRKVEVLQNSAYRKCDIIGSFVGDNKWQNENNLTLMNAYYENETDEYLTTEYQIMLENLVASSCSEGKIVFKLVGCKDLNWYDGISHESSHTWDNYQLGYTNCSDTTKSQSYIAEDSTNIKLTDDVTTSSGFYYKLCCKIPNNNWNNAVITITKESYTN